VLLGAEKAVSWNAEMLSQTIHYQEGNNQKYVLNAFFPCLQEIRMRRSKREEQKTDVWSDKKSEKKFY